MIAWVQNVYENASSRPGGRAGERRLRDQAADDTSGGRRRAAAQMAEKRFSAARGIAGADGADERAWRACSTAGTPGARSFPARAPPPESRRCRRGRRRAAACACTPRRQVSRHACTAADKSSSGDRRRRAPVSVPSPAPRFAATNARTSSTPRVFSTCAGSIQPRRAVPTPNRICRRQRIARWQSLSIAMRHAGRGGTARERAVHVEMPGAPSTSIAVPVSAAAANRRSKSRSIAVRERPATGWRDA